MVIALWFKSSEVLSCAYGTAVSTTMLMTTFLRHDVMRDRWKWSVLLSAGIAIALLVVDVAFFAANLLKIGEGGYVPLAIGYVIYVIITIWHRGATLVRAGLDPFAERRRIAGPAPRPHPTPA